MRVITGFMRRVHSERMELSYKVYHLAAFMAGDGLDGLSKDEQELLPKQLEAMKMYLEVLDRRIYLHGNKIEDE